jgi:RNA polymerase sigma factor (sigma-70 family)
VTKYAALVMTACRRILRDEGLAEDAAQETFVLLIKKARHLPQRTSFGGWLYHAACRIALNQYRSTMRRHIRESSPEAATSTLPEGGA